MNGLNQVGNTAFASWLRIKTSPYARVETHTVETHTMVTHTKATEKQSLNSKSILRSTPQDLLDARQRNNQNTCIVILLFLYFVLLIFTVSFKEKNNLLPELIVLTSVKLWL